MRTTIPARRLTRWGVSLAATGLLSLGGVWVSAQDAESPALDPVPADARVASAATVAPDSAGAQAPAAPPDRDQVPTVAALQAQLTRLRRDTLASVGGPALEHAALALGRARQAEGARDAGNEGAADEALRARRIAYAALTLVAAQREREHARLLRDEAAQARQAADGAARTAEEALRVARANAAAAASAPATATTPSAASAATPAPSGATTAEPAGPSTTEEAP